MTSGTFWQEANGYKLYQCPEESCGHIFVSPTPSDSELVKWYSTTSDTLENSGSWTMASDMERNPDVILNFYERTRTKRLRHDGLLTSETQRILDVGCATGSFLKSLQIQGYSRVSGIEISIEQAAYVRQRLGIEVHANFDSVPDQSVDLVTMYAVLEHAANPARLVAEAFRVLKPGGFVAIDVPNTRSLYRFISRRHWLWLIPPAHLQYFSPRSLKRLLTDVGFQLHRARTLSTSTYLYILVHHLSKLIGRELPGTSLSASLLKRFAIRTAEIVLRAISWPLEPGLRLLQIHNQLIYFAYKP